VASDEHPALRAALVHLVDAETDEPVVDEDVVARHEYVSDHRGRDGQLAVRRGFLRADGDLVPLAEDDRLVQLADPELRPLQVGDERDGTADLGGDLAREPRALGVLGVRAVREVEANSIDAGGSTAILARSRAEAATVGE
jgi:glutamine phosphoribosylpyrophosphate amidotransferase